MFFNFGKCKCLHTGHGNLDVNYKMGDTVLGTTVKEKDLGVTISADMKVSEQCGIAASKGNQILGLIRRNITYKGKKLIIPLYKAIVRPHLECCIQAWRPYCKKDIDTLERIQMRATKIIPELRDLMTMVLKFFSKLFITFTSKFHFTNLSRSFCKCCLSPSVLTFLNTFMSSANFSTLLVIVSSKSLIYIKNNKGPNTVPCGTPLKTDFHFETSPSTTTRCLLSVSRCSIQSIKPSPIPWAFNLSSNL